MWDPAPTDQTADPDHKRQAGRARPAPHVENGTVLGQGFEGAEVRRG